MEMLLCLNVAVEKHLNLTGYTPAICLILWLIYTMEKNLLALPLELKKRKLKMLQINNRLVTPANERSKFFKVKLKPLDADLSNGSMISGHAESIEYDSEQHSINTNYAFIDSKGDIKMVTSNSGVELSTIPQEEKIHHLREKSISEEILETKEAINTLKMRLEDLENQAIQSIRDGKEVPGFKVVPQFTRIKWTLKDNDVIKLGQAHNIVLAKPAKLELITPLQAIKAGIPKDIVKQYSSSELKSYKLVNEGDKPGMDEFDFDSL